MNVVALRNDVPGRRAAGALDACGSAVTGDSSDRHVIRHGGPDRFGVLPD